MKITVLTRFDFPYFGAAESYLRMLALGMKVNKVDVDIVRFSGKLHEAENDLPIPVYNYLTPVRIRNGFFRVLVFMLKWLMIPIFIIRCKYKLKSDVLVIFGFDSPVMLVPFLIWSTVFRLKINRIITEIYPDDLVAPHWYQKPKIWIRTAQNKYIDGWYDSILVLTTSLRELLLRYGVQEKKILLIPHFIDFDKPIKSTSLTNQFRIGFCGTPLALNGIEDLLDALFLLPEHIQHAEVVIFGKITSVIRNLIRSRKPKPNRNIIFTGRLQSKKIHSHLLQCHVLINPRRRGISAETGFPTKVGEYFAAQKPVLTTNCGDLSLYLTDKDQIYFAEPDSPQSLAEVLTYIYDHPEESNQVARRGNEWAKANLDYKLNTQKFKEFLEKEVM